jgi:hypothetical protein
MGRSQVDEYMGARIAPARGGTLTSTLVPVTNDPGVVLRFERLVVHKIQVH